MRAYNNTITPFQKKKKKEKKVALTLQNYSTK